MIEIAPQGSIACGRSGLPLLTVCPEGHRRSVPFRLLKASDDDNTPIYGRPFKCRACGSPEVTLFAIDSQAELDDLYSAIAELSAPEKAPTTHAPPGPNAGCI
jgi:hypothetical protein